MKRVFLVHGWEGNPEKDWFVWIRKELEQKGFSVIAPAMPDPMNPKMDAWVSYLTEAVRTPNQETYFVGHSLGCITILRYLETLQDDQKIGGAVLVAGFGSNLEYADYKNELIGFFETPVDWERTKKHCSSFVAIHSTDDPWVLVKHSTLFHEKLGARSIIEQGRGHYNDKEYPVILGAFLDIATKR